MEEARPPMAVTITFSAPDLEGLVEQLEGFLLTYRTSGRRPGPRPLPEYVEERVESSSESPTSGPTPTTSPPGRACPEHLYELVYKQPGPGATWKPGYYCPQRGCRTYVAAA